VTLFHGLKTGRIENTSLYLDYLLEAGPRIVRLGFLDDGVNLLAETPDIHWDTPQGRYQLYGGHRLWHAPERSDRTHIPDNHPPAVEQDGETLILTAPPEKETGIQKSMRVTLAGDETRLMIDHALTNCGQTTAELAVWPITQLPLGGVFILPMADGPVDPDSKLPNRNLVLWPYSRIQNERIHIEEEVLLLHADDIPESNKIGMFNRTGWLAYVHKNTVLQKQFAPYPASRHVDMNCNVEVYLSGLFVEMETLSPWQAFDPGESITHREVWTLHRLERPLHSAFDVLESYRSGLLPLP